MHVSLASCAVSDVYRLLFWLNIKCQTLMLNLFIYYENRTEVHHKKQLHHKNTSTHLKEARPIA